MKKESTTKTILSKNIRMCVCCRGKDEKSNLLRVTRVNKIFIFDEKHDLLGRSIYVHKDRKCIDKFKKMHKRFNIGDDEFNQILSRLEEYAK